MDEELERDPNVMVLGEDVGKKGGVFGATEGLLAKYGEKRVLDTPLTEGMIAGAAMGAAIYGLRPIAEMQFADFVYPAFNQIVSEISRMRYRSNGAFGLPMVIRMPYGGGVHGALYHSQSNEAYFTSTVGLKVVAPGTPADAKGLLKAAVRDPDPVMFFEHKKTYRLFKAEVPDGDHVVPIGSAEVARSGKDLSIFCYGYMRTCALEAAETLARDDGVEAEVVDLRTLRPLDTATVLASVAQDRQGAGRARGEPIRRLRRRGRGLDCARSASSTWTDRSPAWPGRRCRASRSTTSWRTGSCSTPQKIVDAARTLAALLSRCRARPSCWPIQMDEAYRFVHDRVQGLTDDEFFWEPVADCWTVRLGADGRWHGDYAEPDPDPPPFTTIAWRLVHLAECKVMYHEYAFGPGTADLAGDRLGPHRGRRDRELERGQRLLVDALDGLTDADLDARPHDQLGRRVADLADPVDDDPPRSAPWRRDRRPARSLP